VLETSGKIQLAAVGVTGLGPKAFRAAAVEQALIGKIGTPRLFAEAARHAAQDVEILSDLHASREYRREMAAVFGRRALEHAFARAKGQSQ
jgi:carbon-monoxide dehydrogenase medium subunit